MTVSSCAGLLACLFLLVACDPALKDADARGGSVTNAAGMQGRKAFALARAHCRIFGRQAKLSSALDMTENLLTFTCEP